MIYGYAITGHGCDKLNGYAVSITEYAYDDDHTTTARTLAHEIGHSLGMK